MRLTTISSRPAVRLPSLSSAISSRPDTWFDLLAAAIILVVALTVLQTPIGSGDYGQWLMVSRHYAGESVPGYRDVSAIPPLMPLLIAVTTRVITDPVLALTTIKVSLAVVFVGATYWAGTGIFRDKAAGLLAACFTFFVSDRMLELYAFGGLPQLGALIFIALAMGSFGRAAGGEKLELRWWVFGAAGIFCAALTHAGTGVLAILSGGAVAGAIALTNPRFTWRERMMALSPLAGAMALLAPYWLLVVLPSNGEYLVNTASLYYRGPWAFWKRLGAHDLNLVLLGGATVVLLAGVAWDLGRSRLGAYGMLAVWAVVCWTFFGLTALASVGTEYARFQYPLLQPLGIALGGGTLWLLRSVTPQARNQAEQGWYLAPLAGLALIIMVAGPTTMAAFHREARTYRLPGLDSLLASIEDLDGRLGDEQVVLSTVGVGKWVEGVTGRPALFAMPNRYSFREVEIGRSLAADALIRSSFCASDGQFFLRYTGLTDETPTHPWVAINHRGEYVDLLQLRPEDLQFIADGKVVGTLAALAPSEFEVVDDEYVIYVRSVFVGVIQGEPVELEQEMVLETDANTLAVTYSMTSGPAIDELQAQIAPVAEAPVETTLAGPRIDLEFLERAKAPPRVSVRAPARLGERVAYDEATGRVIVIGDAAHDLEIEFSIVPTAPPINQPAVYWPAEIVDEYQVGAAILPLNSATLTRRGRLEALGFRELGETDENLVLIREAGVGEDYPAKYEAP